MNYMMQYSLIDVQYTFTVIIIFMARNFNIDVTNNTLFPINPNIVLMDLNIEYYLTSSAVTNLNLAIFISDK